MKSEEIMIVFTREGEHYIVLPDDESIEFDARTVLKVAECLMVLEEPSIVLRCVLWVERQLRRLNAKLFAFNN